MPGVPHGKGCENCRKQKKKCDLAKPSCSRCARLKKPCIGAGDQRFKFIQASETQHVATIESPNRRPSSGAPPTPARSFSRASTSYSARSTPEASPPSFSSPKWAITERPRDTTRGPDMRISIFQSPAMHRYQLRQAFSTSYYDGSVISTNPEYMKTYHWMGPENTTLQTSLDALSLIHLGDCLQDPQLLNEGQQRYGQALSLIRSDIQQKNAVANDAILGACYTAAHCQSYKAMSRSSTGWQVHMDGLYYLLEKRGPESIKSHFAQTVYRSIRHVAVSERLFKRKSTFLAKPEWRPKKEGIHDSEPGLTEIAFLTAAILEQTDVLTKRLTIDPVPILQRDVHLLLDRIAQVRQQLDHWLTTFYALGGPYQAPTTHHISSYPTFVEFCGNIEMPTEDVYQYASLVSATSHVIFWITKLSLLQAKIHLTSIFPLSSNESHQAIDATTITDMTTCESIAVDLLKTLAFLSLPDHHSIGMLACSMPLHWAGSWYEFRRDAKDLLVCRRLREALLDCPTSLDLRNPVSPFWMIPQQVA